MFCRFSRNHGQYVSILGEKMAKICFIQNRQKINALFYSIQKVFSISKFLTPISLQPDDVNLDI